MKTGSKTQMPLLSKYIPKRVFLGSFYTSSLEFSRPKHRRLSFTKHLYRFLITRQIQEHHLVPLALKGGHLSSSSSWIRSFATAFFCFFYQVVQKGCLDFHSSMLEVSCTVLSFWGHLHPQNYLLHLYYPQRLNVLRTCNPHSCMVHISSSPHLKLKWTETGLFVSLAVSVTSINIT